MGQAKRKYDVPTERLLDHSVDVDQALPVSEVWQTVGADDAVELRVRLRLDLGILGYGEE